MPEYCPRYHFAPPSGWMNDPNGLVYHRGEYHLFYQWHPELICAAAAMAWGHAVSSDLVRWQHLPVAIEPDELGAIWSGSAVEDINNTSGLFPGQPGGGLAAVFTHHGHDGAERQSLAFSHDRGRSWTKYPHNPVLGDNACREFRDPKVFWHGPTGRWIMIVGVRHRLYASPDLINWSLLGETGFSSECPDLFLLPVENEAGVRWVLSLAGREYVIGEFNGARFEPQGEPVRVDGGLDFYAAQSWDNSPKGRRIWVAWMNNWKYARQVPDFGSRGFMTVPRQLSLRRGECGTLRLVQAPVAELESLRQERIGPDAAGVQPGQILAEGDSLEIVAVMSPAPGDQCGLKVRAAGRQETLVGYDASVGSAFVDRTRSGLAPLADKSSIALPLRTSAVALRVFVDRSSVEAFFNDGAAVISSQVYSHASSTGVAWFTEDGRSRLDSLAIYRMGP